MSKTRFIMRFIFVLVLLIIIYFMTYNNFISLNWLEENLEKIKYYANEKPLLAIILFFLIRFFFAVVSIPGSGVLTILGGILFGVWLGTILTTLSVSLGTLVVFLLTRYAFRDYIKNKFQNKFIVIDKISKKHGASLLFFVRVIEIVPSFIINSFFAFTPVKISTYFLASLAGIFPGILIFVNAGYQINNIKKASDIMSFEVIISLGIVAVIPLVSSVVYRYIKNS